MDEIAKEYDVIVLGTGTLHTAFLFTPLSALCGPV
jgi:RAB protein geranylgeranyltransferase component A